MSKILALAPAIIFFCAAILVPKAHANDEIIDWMMADEQQTLDASLEEFETTLTDTEAETAALNNQLQTEQEMLTNAYTDIATTEEYIADLEEQIATLEEQQTSNTDSSTDIEAEIASLEAQLSKQSTLLSSQQATATKISTSINDTQAELADNLKEQAALEEQIQQANDLYDAELKLVSSQIDAMSANQIKAILHAITRATSSGINVQLDSEQLAIILANDYSFQKTNLLMKGYTEEAKFLSKAEALRAEAEATGNEQLLKVADMMEQRATDMKNKFSDLAAGHPARSEEQVSEEELSAAENAARGTANKPTAHGNNPNQNEEGTSNKPDNSGNDAKPSNTGTINQGKGGNGNSGAKENKGGQGNNVGKGKK